MDWRATSGEREKYQAYLCSREWGVKKEAVRKRAGGICERCNANQMDHVHHLTYARKYQEELGDLRALCKPCHDFAHGRASYDPAADGRVRIGGLFAKTFYLAGRITKTRWRDEIVDGWSFENHSQSNQLAMAGYYHCGRKLWHVVHGAAKAGDIFLDYAGPWWSPVNGGHGDVIDFASPHAYELDQSRYGEEPPTGVATKPPPFEEIRRNIDAAIDRSDLVFAWIDSVDCFGTLVELGIASAKGKAVIVAFSESLPAREFWLAASYAHRVVVAKTAGEAWIKAWSGATEGQRKEVMA